MIFETFVRSLSTACSAALAAGCVGEAPLGGADGDTSNTTGASEGTGAAAEDTGAGTSRGAGATTGTTTEAGSSDDTTGILTGSNGEDGSTGSTQDVCELYAARALECVPNSDGEEVRVACTEALHEAVEQGAACEEAATELLVCSTTLSCEAFLSEDLSECDAELSAVEASCEGWSDTGSTSSAGSEGGSDGDSGNDGGDPMGGTTG